MAAANTQLLRLSEEDRCKLEFLLKEFEDTWTDGCLNDRVRQLPPADSALRAAALIELVKIDLERQWAAGRRPDLESYLSTYPELGTADSVPADLIQAEFEVRKQFGDPTDFPD